MAHPLYHHAVRLTGRPVYVHHLDGRVSQGILHSVTYDGVYLLNCRPAYLASFEEHDTQLDVSDASNRAEPELIYAPGAFFAFGALAGFTAGALAGRYWW
ncbi:hypothetical protein [Alicyclobacillus sp. SO9]|uniref:hypothetical protein n=1 Tax=Alicyclobacillus sp. SO9 TaxID=2665646 RepID=UPI0018E704AE|nr:hypothetical protein [Alicyclobacillus sp. SO9]QQE79876.1 hypothetical protein GI364_05165 [Alicyclobacillus sp. SO9]